METRSWGCRVVGVVKDFVSLVVACRSSDTQSGLTYDTTLSGVVLVVFCRICDRSSAEATSSMRRMKVCSRSDSASAGNDLRVLLSPGRKILSGKKVVPIQ